MILTGKTEDLGGKPVPVPLCPPKNSHGMTRAQTRTSCVRGRRLAAPAVVRCGPYLLIGLFACFRCRSYLPCNEIGVYLCQNVRSKKKVKQPRYTPWRRLGERKYSSYSFTTWALDGVSGERHAPAALYPRGRDPPPPVPIVQEAGWAPE
jgi:hypothetical protein